MVTFELSEKLQYLKVLNFPVGRPLEIQLENAPASLVLVAAPNISSASSVQVEAEDGLFRLTSFELDTLGPIDETIYFTVWQALPRNSFEPRLKGEIRRVDNGEQPNPSFRLSYLTHQGKRLTHGGSTLTFPTS